MRICFIGLLFAFAFSLYANAYAELGTIDFEKERVNYENSAKGAAYLEFCSDYSNTNKILMLEVSQMKGADESQLQQLAMYYDNSVLSAKMGLHLSGNSCNQELKLNIKKQSDIIRDKLISMKQIMTRLKQIEDAKAAKKENL